MRIATHSGMFHADDVFAVVTALLVFPNAHIIRTRNQTIIDESDMAIDVGMEYDPERLRFDHHQQGGAEVRPNGVPYAAFGLVWKEFGYRLAREGAAIIDEKLVIPVDAPDNNVPVYEPAFDGIEPYTIRDFFYSYLPYEGRTEKQLDKTFIRVVKMAKGILEREITKAEERVNGMREVRRIVETSSSKHIIVVERDLPWEPVLVRVPEAVFVVYPRREGAWAVKAVPRKVQSVERRKLFPYAWAGKSGQELVEACGVPGAHFCHLGRFIATAESKEAACLLAERALNA